MTPEIRPTNCGGDRRRLPTELAEAGPSIFHCLVEVALGFAFYVGALLTEGLPMRLFSTAALVVAASTASAERNVTTGIVQSGFASHIISMTEMETGHYIGELVDGASAEYDCNSTLTYCVHESVEAEEWWMIKLDYEDFTLTFSSFPKDPSRGVPYKSISPMTCETVDEQVNAYRFEEQEVNLSLEQHY